MGDENGFPLASREIDKIAPALVKAINAIHAVRKDNQGHGYRYADLASCLDEARRVLGDVGMTVMQPMAVRTMTSVVGGQVVDLHVPTIRTVVMHESGQWVASETIVPDGGGAPKMSPTQVIGSNVTYMKRYALCAMLAIPTEDDDGGRGQYREPDRRDRSEPRRQQPPSRPSEPKAEPNTEPLAAPTSLAHRDALKAIIHGATEEWSAFARAEGVNATLGLTVAAVESMIVERSIKEGKVAADRFGDGGRLDPVKVAAYLSRVFGSKPDKFEGVATDLVSSYIADRKASLEREAVDAVG